MLRPSVTGRASASSRPRRPDKSCGFANASSDSFTLPVAVRLCHVTPQMGLDTRMEEGRGEKGEEVCKITIACKRRVRRRAERFSSESSNDVLVNDLYVSSCITRQIAPVLLAHEAGFSQG
ncbi:hypothetical protein RRG08_023077 [Elysia crispata]|uniref:Uncharacterized protein n=1 Tax=Elysia crispata TaxID=231223 RepID=A0AAE1ARN5_9GAST|nr:hypothetical protein RRG08_023077 [Elysia crispata]